MNTLPRSSFSFRRQGSSGRIWQDQIQFVEPNANASASLGTSLGNNKIIKEKNVSQIEGDIMGRRLHDNSKRVTRSSSASKIHNNKNWSHHVVHDSGSNKNKNISYHI
ncbi:hypothetical protein GmHk_19G053772 [Glycine max]|uniref:Uncharacterized protein n=1 Tax=Glycine max TaxID=3847 RepID=K7MW01_SOYBN|nr:hypothetical protein GmHk_19G053772 [Glycine max]